VRTLGAGSHAVTAVYASDSNFGISTAATLTQTVNPGATTTTVTAQGQATLTITMLSAGSHTITASYGGDANFDQTLSPVFTELVNP
jgi:hypothetical protein